MRVTITILPVIGNIQIYLTYLLRQIVRIGIFLLILIAGNDIDVVAIMFSHVVQLV